MKIIEKTYVWCGTLTKRPKTDFIVLHHMAGDGSAESIHTSHLKNGWAGIGYHFFVKKDGSVYRGRPLDKSGAHVSGYNSQCVGICFEGNFEKETMPQAQLDAGRELVLYLKKIYPKAKLKQHKDLNATACPGKNFPFGKLTKTEYTEVSDIVKSLGSRGIMTNSGLWSKKCVADTNSYWLARKICNMTVNSLKRNPALDRVNDIVWELNQRGIILDMPLWLKLFKKDKDLYWLGYKACNTTRNEV